MVQHSALLSLMKGVCVSAVTNWFHACVQIFGRANVLVGYTDSQAFDKILKMTDSSWFSISKSPSRPGEVVMNEENKMWVDDSKAPNVENTQHSIFFINIKKYLRKNSPQSTLNTIKTRQGWSLCLTGSIFLPFSTCKMPLSDLFPNHNSQFCCYADDSHTVAELLQFMCISSPFAKLQLLLHLSILRS